MRVFLLLLVTIISAISLSSYAQSALPDDAVELLSKLDSFEADELQRAYDAILTKRKAVVEILEAQMDRETRNGNLEGAVALKDKIAELSSTKLEGNPNQSASTAEEDKSSVPYFVGPVWVPNSGFDVQYQFRPDGSGIKVFKGEIMGFTWNSIEGTFGSDRVMNLKISVQSKHDEVFYADSEEEELWSAEEDGSLRMEFEVSRRIKTLTP